MHTKTFFLAALATIGTLGASAASAEGATYEYPVVSTSVVSRAEVQAETLRARAAGLIAHGDRNVLIADTGVALTRAQVKAETLEAIRLGAISRHEQNVEPTAVQLERIRQAGLKALAMTMASL
jgi:hypothetical protein